MLFGPRLAASVKDHTTGACVVDSTVWREGTGLLWWWGPLFGASLFGASLQHIEW